jgi:hypothetical protein
MTYPTYIKLTLTKVTTPAPGNRQGMMHQTHLQPPIVKMFPLPLAIGKQQTGEPFAEVDLAPGVTGTCAEHFDDVVQAIEDASSRGDIVVKPVQREAIAAAVAGSLKAIESALGGMGYAKAAPSTGDESITWNDAGMGEALPEPKAGDLRMFASDSGEQPRVWIEIRAKEGDGWSWVRDGVPNDLKASFDTIEAAARAIKVAGYSRRLVNA